MNSDDENESNQQGELKDSAENLAENSAENNVSDSRPNHSISGSLVGVRLGDYQVLRKLGKGGMADVYAARHLSLGRDVAIKVLRSDYARDKDYVARFRREARAAAKLNHANIVQVYDVGDVNDVHFITQELIDGKNLREHLETQGSLSPEEAVKTLESVGAALKAATEVGITHRDIKPENIMCSSRGDIKVADFGLARLGGDSDGSTANLTQAGLTMGTPRYMSPEQVQGKIADSRSDLYSLGVTMYHLVAGQPPFDADEPLALAVKHLHETPEPVDRVRGNDDLPEWLIAVISRLMSKLPEDRFQSPQELLDAIATKTSASSTTYEAIGAAAATVRLQRAADATTAQKRSRGFRWAITYVLAFLAAVGAAGYAFTKPADTVVEMLRPEKVMEAGSVKEQFWTAMTRDDQEAWNAVSAYYPADASNENCDYFAKSMLQLARLRVDQGDFRGADKALERLLRNPQVDRRFRLIAWSKRCEVLERVSDPRRLKDAKRQQKLMYDEANANYPAAISLFEHAIPEEQRLQFMVEAVDPADD